MSNYRLINPLVSLMKINGFNPLTCRLTLFCKYALPAGA